MIYISIIILLIVAVVLFSLSYFQKTPAQQSREEVEELLLATKQEIFQLNERVAKLEIALKDARVEVPRSSTNTDVHVAAEAETQSISKKQAKQIQQNLAQGEDVPKIAYKMHLPLEVVQSFVANNKKQGK